MKKYKIILNQHQVSILCSALEVFYRLHSGQWEMPFNQLFRFQSMDYCEKMDANNSEFYSMLDRLKKILLGLEPNASYGVGSKECSPDMTRAFDVHQVLRTALGDERAPMQFSDIEPPEISEIKESKNVKKKNKTKRKKL